MKQYVMVNKFGMAWAVRFYSEDAAWRRLLALKGLADTKDNRARLAAAGWHVATREAVSA